MQDNQPTLEWFKPADWVNKFGGEVFPTMGAFEWFKRQHKQEMLEKGVLLKRGGRMGDLIHRDFGKYALEVMTREQAA